MSYRQNDKGWFFELPEGYTKKSVRKVLPWQQLAPVNLKKRWYQGEYLDGKRDGMGIELQSRHQMIVGFFKEDQFHGPQISVSLWGTKTVMTYIGGVKEGKEVKTFMRGPPVT